GGDNIVDLVEEEEDVEDEENGRKVPGEDVIDFGFEGGKKVSSGVERKGGRGVTRMGSEEEEEEVVGSGEGEEQEMAAIREKLRKVAKGVAGLEKDKVTMGDVEEKLRTLEQSPKDDDVDAGASRAEGCETTDQGVKEMKEELMALQRECAE
ncbi:MAG: hypothetical protein LQ346_006659, partial [Caloplaca aetnensis]